MSKSLACTSPRAIAELNIEHYRRVLETTLDERTRMTVERLLAEERAKLANCLRQQDAL